MSYDNEEIFEFNDDFEVPQSPTQYPIEQDDEDYNYSYSNTYSNNYSSDPYGSSVGSVSSTASSFLYECVICNTTSATPCEHISELEEAHLQLNNQWLMQNYRKWQDIIITN